MAVEAEDIGIEPAGNADLPALCSLYYTCLADGTGALEAPPVLADLNARFAAPLNAGLPVLVARYNATVIGFGVLNRYLPYAGFDRCAASEVWIAPEARGQGLGWAMLRDLLIAARSTGLRQVIAHLRADSDAALALHERLGFGSIGRHRDACEVGGRLHDIIVMRRSVERLPSAGSGHVIRPAMPAAAGR